MSPQSRESLGPGRFRQNAVFRAGLAGEVPAVPSDPSALAGKARAAMSEQAWAYVHGGAGSGATMSANREAFDRWQLVPRVLAGSSRQLLSTRILDTVLPAPVLLAPCGAASMVRPDADREICRAVAATGVPYVFSCQAGISMEDAAAAVGTAPHWFQLYWSSDEDLVDSLLERARVTKAEALMVTVDVPVLGWRPADLDLASLPFAQGHGLAQYTCDPRFAQLVAQRMKNTSADGDDPLAEVRAQVETFLEVFAKRTLSWDDIASLRQRTRLPVVVKGILHPDDARKAFDSGVDAIVVSNHGGRQLDCAVSALDALADVRKAVGDQATVLMDSGIRSGTDVFKAIALGADAVLLGRPYLYGLAIDGEAGVRAVIENVLAELDLTMALAGVADLSEIRSVSMRPA